ncbi:unnamed protein product [Pleuronectes platessa]|uniref:Uncharacterized protein n=1 Tax=Pleuronectes platessa TaxID=8262 RepID=A0A9N7VKD4_PLEPL|nr:unnamed protein product [Pleuronectes platessa]
MDSHYVSPLNSHLRIFDQLKDECWNKVERLSWLENKGQSRGAEVDARCEVGHQTACCVSSWTPATGPLSNISTRCPGSCDPHL